MNQLFGLYDADNNNNFSVDEFIDLYCTEIKDDGDGGNPPVDTNCPSDKEFDSDICQCVKKDSCGRSCEPPLISDPVTKCDCITITEFTNLYNHTLDDNC